MPDGIVAIFILAILVSPIAIIGHYLTKWRSMKTLSADDERLFDDLWKTAQALEKRVDALETILEQEAPDWRSRHE